MELSNIARTLFASGLFLYPASSSAAGTYQTAFPDTADPSAPNYLHDATDSLTGIFAVGERVTYPSGGISDVLVLKIDPKTGKELIRLVYGTSGADAAYSVKPSRNGDVFVSGRLNHVNNSAIANGFVTRIRPNGSVAWQYEKNDPLGTAYDSISDSVETYDGHIIAIGQRAYGSGYLLVITELDPSGTLINEHHIGDDVTSHYPTQIIETKNRDLVVISSTGSPSSDQDVHVIRFRRNGASLETVFDQKYAAPGWWQTPSMVIEDTKSTPVSFSNALSASGGSPQGNITNIYPLVVLANSANSYSNANMYIGRIDGRSGELLDAVEYGSQFGGLTFYGTDIEVQKNGSFVLAAYLSTSTDATRGDAVAIALDRKFNIKHARFFGGDVTDGQGVTQFNAVELLPNDKILFLGTSDAPELLQGATTPCGIAIKTDRKFKVRAKR